jgi:hypothetical protein
MCDCGISVVEGQGVTSAMPKNAGRFLQVFTALRNLGAPKAIF